MDWPPEGRLIACDPFSDLDGSLDGPFVRVTLADVSGRRDGGDPVISGFDAEGALAAVHIDL